VPYLDWNATTPPLPEVLDAMRDAARDAWGNPSSVHRVGRAARSRVEAAREAVATLAEADPRDVTLTSGGTEANNLALRSAFGAFGVLVTSRLEHPSVTRVAEALAHEGRARVVWVKVGADGVVDLDDLDRALAEPDVRLVAVQAVNHETGVIQPIGEVIRRARVHPAGPRVHVDAVQAFGRLGGTVMGDLARADTVSLAAHKIRGPKGIGALVARAGARIEPVLVGGAQERGLRPGTIDAVACAGFEVAARYALGSGVRYLAAAPLRDRLEKALVALGATRAGSGPRAPHVTCVVVPRWRGPELVAALDLEGLNVSSGSACSAGTAEPSPAVLAMLGHDAAESAVRFSLGEDTTSAEIDTALAILARVVPRA
jgi:cysteine desulfurase